jgi:hypothetical protein
LVPASCRNTRDDLMMHGHADLSALLAMRLVLP